jgi:hypothetical protein
MCCLSLSDCYGASTIHREERALRLVMARHALQGIAKRKLDPRWVERIALRRDWTEPDPQPGVMRHCGVAPGLGNRVLRVPVADRRDERHVISAFPDRAARRRRS